MVQLVTVNITVGLLLKIVAQIFTVMLWGWVISAIMLLIVYIRSNLLPIYVRGVRILMPIFKAISLLHVWYLLMLAQLVVVLSCRLVICLVLLRFLQV